MVKSYLRYSLTSLFGSSVHTAVRPVSFAGANGRPLVATCSSDVVHVWDLKTGRTATFWSREASRASHVTALEIAVNSGYLLAGYSDGTIRAWDVSQADMTVDVALESAEAYGIFLGHSSAVTVVTVHDEDGAGILMCSGSASGELILWDFSSRAPIRRVSAHVNATSGVAFCKHQISSADEERVSYVISSSIDGNIRVFAAELSQCVQTIPATIDIKYLNIDSEGQYLIAGSSKEYHLFTIQQTKDEEELVADIGVLNISGVSTKDTIIDLAQVSGESVLLIANSKSELTVFKFRSNEDAAKRHRRKRRKIDVIDRANDDTTGTAKNLDHEERQASKSKEKPLMTVNDYIVKVATLRCESRIRSLSCLRGRRGVLASSEGGSLCTIVGVTSNGMETFRLIRSQSSESKPHSSHGNSLRYGAQELVKGITITAEGHQHEIGHVAMFADEQIMSAGANCVKTWDVRTGKCTLSVSFPTAVSCCAFAPPDASSALACLANGSICIFNTHSGMVGNTLESAHEGAIRGLWTDASGTRASSAITCGVDGFIRYWDLSNLHNSPMKCVGEVKLPDEISCMRAECSERMVLCAALMDCTVRCIDLNTNREKLSLYGHKLPVVGMDISTDGTILVTAATDKTVKVWGLEFGDCRRSFWCSSSLPRCVLFQPKTHFFFTGAMDGVITYWDCDRLDSVAPLNDSGSSVRFLGASSDGEILVSVSEDRMFRLWYRSDEQIFLEEEKENRLAETLEAGDKTRANPEAASARSKFDQLVRTLEVCTSPEDAKELQVMGVNSEDYIAQALLRVPFGVLERELNTLPFEYAGLLLLCVLSKIKQDNVSTISGELYASTALLLLKQFKGSLTEKLANRNVLRRLYVECKAKLASCVDAVGFCQSALQMCAQEMNSS